MAGHSKWANIKFKKAAQDKKRGKLFTKLIREISVAAKMGGADITANPRLRQAVDKALRGNMTRDAIDRAIKRGAGGDDGAEMLAMTYEGYGANGVAVLVECLSDNKNRTVSEVRHAFSKFGGNLGTSGSVSYLFEKIGQIVLEPSCEEDQVMNIALETGATDIETQEDGSILVETGSEDFLTVKEALEAKDLPISYAEVTMRASTEIDLDEEASLKVLKMIDMLEDCDDVQEVYSNANFDEKAMESM